MQRLRPYMALFYLCLSVTARAQYNVGTINFDGDSRYAEKQLAAASGLKPGDPVGSKELGEAAQRLMDTGLFDDIDTKLEGPYKAIHIRFRVKALPDEKLLPAVFENFVWYTPEELRAGLQSRVPLFRERLPEAGNLQTTVIAALTQMLAEKQVEAKVEASVEPGNASTPNPFLNFRVASPAVVLQAVRLDGVTPAMQAGVNATVKQVVGHRYHEGDAAAADRRILEEYLNAGYRDARLEDLKRVPVLEGNVVRVTLTGTVRPGDQFTTGNITWNPTPLFSADDFARANKLRPGEPFSQKAVEDLQKAMLAAYHNAGYVDAVLDAHATSDAATHTVNLNYTVAPGEPYRMEATEVVGLSPAQQKQFESAWRLIPGTTFDESYVQGFLKNNTALLSLNGFAAAYKVISDPQKHTVRVVMTFVGMNRG